jgi:methylornithine synthase
MIRSHHRKTFWHVLDRARHGYALDAEDMAKLFSTRQATRIEALCETARTVREHHFGRRVFLYGFVYTSTYCRNDCVFCYYRRSNASSVRYRKTEREIIEISRRLADLGVHLIDLTMGEDPDLYRHGPHGFEKLADLVVRVRSTTGLPVMVSPGGVPDGALKTLAEAGATWYACYQETHNPALFGKLRIGQSFSERMRKKTTAQQLGLLIEEGVLCGIGETDGDLIESIELMQAMNADQVRAMTFIPQMGTPLEGCALNTSQRELVTLAVMRLAFPDRLIPASLDVDGLAGLRGRLKAGANVVTSIVPPGQGLAGVARSSLDIDTARRTCKSVHRVLSDLGLQAADLGEYLAWIESRQREAAHGLWQPSHANRGRCHGGAGPCIG